jgi:hypothetical protein
MIDAVSLALKTVNRWEIPLRTVSECTGYPISELWLYFQDKKQCPNDRALVIAETVRTLDAFAKSAQPIPVAWKRSGKIKELVDKFRAGDLRIAVTDVGEVVEGDFVMGDLIGN